MTIFDARQAERLAERGKNLAADSRPELVALAKSIAHSLPQPVSMDDVAREMLAMGLEPSALGNAAGCLFRGWKAVGFIKSERVSTHGRMIRTWERQ